MKAIKKFLTGILSTIATIEFSCPSKSLLILMFSSMYMINEGLCQDECTKKHIIPLNKVVTFSTVHFLSNYSSGEGKGYVVSKSGERREIPAFQFNDTIEVELKDDDKLEFLFEVINPEPSRPIDPIICEMKIEENTPFKPDIKPGPNVPQYETGDTLVRISSLRYHFGQKIFTIEISDDAYPFRIKVEPLEKSSPFIELVRTGDDKTFILNLKSKTEIDNIQYFSSQKKTIKSKIENDEYGIYELNIPIGFKIYDPVFPNQLPDEYDLYLNEKIIFEEGADK